MERELFEGFNLVPVKSRFGPVYEIKERSDGRYNMWRLYINTNSPQRQRVWQIEMVVDVPPKGYMKDLYKWGREHS